MERQRLVVIGNGMAGARTVEEILTRAPDLFDITMFGEEPHGNYNRIALSHVLAGEEDFDSIFLNSLAWYAANGITLHAGVRAKRIDRFAKVVYADDGSETRYDKLIIATGSRSFIPDIPGIRDRYSELRSGVFGFRTIEDTRAMLEHARGGERRAVVIGGGLLGLEAAHGLHKQGTEVTVLQRSATIMNQQLDAAGGEVLAGILQNMGIRVITNARTVAVDYVPRVGIQAVQVEGQDPIPCDMVVVTAGIRPETSVALISGFTVARAIVVDDLMRTVDDDDVYAVGECVQHRGEVYGLVAPLWEQGAVLAANITGTDPSARYSGTKTTTKLKVAGIDLASMGVRTPEREGDEQMVFSEPKRGVYKSVIVRENKVIGATMLGDASRVPFLTRAFDQGLDLPETRAELLFDLGTTPEQSVADLPDDAQICNCNGVTKGTIVGAVHDGCTSLGAVMDATRAGKGCGSCKEQVCAILAWAAGDAVTVDASANWYVPGVPMGKPELMAAIREQNLRSVSSVFAALAPDGQPDARSKMGLASLLKMMWGPDYVDERDARFINDRVHANIQKDGTFSVVPQLKGGVTSPEQLRRIADVAEKYDVPMVKLTGGQRIDLLGIRKEDLPKVWADLDMPSGYAYGKSFRTVKTCVGQEFCRFGTGDSTSLGIDMETRFQGLESPAKIKLAVSGCPRNCAESLVKDVGVVAVEGGRWELWIGGAAGAHIRKGDLFVTVDSREEAILLAGRFIQYYRENAKWLERTYTFVPRLGLEELQAILVADRDGVCAGLDERLQESVDNYADPWLDRDAPATPGQFRTALPLVALPLVPVRGGDA
ncbi:nitrite reductase large subunit NirB [Propioniciclava soli]|uniref:nitrite reductase large subunit NirB n=1 Tax=Propioniciclava soli TaxID=2775081 RepID=UPI001E480C64|nr:nitrite reductase large subunit NirB [Propioniciclava soli]